MTAERYARLLRQLGHHVTVGLRERDCDVLFALHARKSAAAMRRFHRAHPHKPIILVLTGTDVYGSRPLPALALATRIIVLQPEALRKLPARCRARAVSIIQSAVVRHRKPDRKHFTICFLGHLRAVKDPFRAAYAVRDLPADSFIRLIQAGEAHTPAMAARARAEMRKNPRYRWLGSVPQQRAHALLASSRLLVLTSMLEGGANVVCEALAAGVPVISSDIDGSRGLLGRDYPGFFPVGDTHALRALLLRAEQDSYFYQRLQRACRRRAKLIDPANERAGLGQVVGPLRIRSN